MTFDPEATTGAPPRRFRDPGNGWVTPAEKVIMAIGAAIVLFICCTIAWFSYSMERTRDAVLANRTETAENRAVGCQLLIAMGQPLPPTCTEDQAVRANYDPGARPSPTRTAGLICMIAKEVGVLTRDLPTVCAEVDGDG